MGKKINLKAKQGKASASEESSQVLCLIKGLAVAYAITCIVFICYAIILTYTPVTEKYIPLVAIICTIVATVVAGYDTAKGAKSRGLIWGIAAGAVYVCILFVIGIFMGEGTSFSTGKITSLLISAAGGGLGGILGINKS